MQGRNAQVARIYRILNLLEGTPQGLSTTEIWRRLSERDVEVSKRTVYRDLEALNDAGFPLFPQGDESGDAGATRWVLERGAKVNQYLALTSDELFALHLARGLVGQLKGSPVHPDLESAFGKIQEKLGSARREHFAELSTEVRFERATSTGLELGYGLLETVRAACAEGQVLSVDYESVNSGTRSRRRLGPHYVYFARGSAYLIADELATGQTKVFALPRMSNAVMEDEPFEGKSVEPEKFFAASFGIFHGGEPERVKIAFGKQVARFVQERRWHPTQKLKTLADGGLELSMNVAVTPELVQWVLGFGPDAKVIDSQCLRARVSTAVMNMVSLYSTTTTSGA